jgi:uncharacterized protein
LHRTADAGAAQSRVDAHGPDPAALQQQLDRLPPPTEPLDVVMLDGYLCAVLLREQALPIDQWLPFVFDIEGRAGGPTDRRAGPKQAVLQRHASLKQAITRRQWFDPWVFELDGDGDPAQAVMPWAAGFALAAERFALPLPLGNDAADEALALIYQYLDADDFPAVAALQDPIDLLEPPTTLAQAVEDLVGAVLLLADLTGPAAAGKRGSAPR